MKPCKFRTDMQVSRKGRMCVSEVKFLIFGPFPGKNRQNAP